MEYYIEKIIGPENYYIAWWQACIRGMLMFIIGLLLVRIAGIRTFGKKSAADNIIIFLIGSLLSRPVVGHASFIHTVLAALVIVIVHRLIRLASFYHKGFERFIKGKNVLIYENDRFDYKIMRRHCISEEEITESVRRNTNSEDFAIIDKIYFEPSGRISIIKKI